MSDTDTDEGLDLVAAVQLFVGLGSRMDAVARSNQDLVDRIKKATPIKFRPVASVVSNGDGDDILIDLGTPAKGTFWEVRKVVVGGVTITDARGGAGALVVAATTDINAVSIAVTEDLIQSLPAVAYYPSGTIHVRPEEHLLVYVTDVDSSATYAANAYVMIFSETTPIGDAYSL